MLGYVRRPQALSRAQAAAYLRGADPAAAGEAEPLHETERVREARRRRADAIGWVAERTLAASFEVGREEEGVSAETSDSGTSSTTSTSERRAPSESWASSRQAG